MVLHTRPTDADVEFVRLQRKWILFDSELEHRVCFTGDALRCLVILLNSTKPEPTGGSLGTIVVASASINPASGVVRLRVRFFAELFLGRLGFGLEHATI